MMKGRKTLSNNQISKKAKSTMFKPKNKKMNNLSKTTNPKARTMPTLRPVRRRLSTLSKSKSRRTRFLIALPSLALASTIMTMLLMPRSPSKR